MGGLFLETSWETVRPHRVMDRNIDHVRLGKFLSYVLRYRPDTAGVTLDSYGCAQVGFFLAGTSKQHPITREFLEEFLSMSRQHVHLSHDIKTATAVGRRHGNPIGFEMVAGQMFRKGYVFCISENGIWLMKAKAVPVKYLQTFPL